MDTIQKWGFGMAPLKKKTDYENKRALKTTSDYVRGGEVFKPQTLPDECSRAKGIFNRIIRQDQWDWFTVNMYLDYPSDKDLRNIVDALTMLRKAILESDEALAKKMVSKLIVSNYVRYCYSYLHFDINEETEAEYLYILSRREQNDVLKIGMTTRNVQKRVNEINSATGIVYPFSARKVYKVNDSKKVEKDIHKILSEYRICADREFFKIEYRDACKIIEEYLSDNNQNYYE